MWSWQRHFQLTYILPTAVKKILSNQAVNYKVDSLKGHQHHYSLLKIELKAFGITDKFFRINREMSQLLDRFDQPVPLSRNFDKIIWGKL